VGRADHRRGRRAGKRGVNLAVGTVAMGLLLSLLALGVFVALRVLHSLDLTVDGAFGVGAAVAAALIVRGASPVAATMAGAAAGMAAGAVTGIVTTRLRIDVLLAGILTSTALYSVMLYVMGGGDVSVAGQRTVFSAAEEAWRRAFGSADDVTILGVTATTANWSSLVLLALVALATVVALSWFFRTRVGLAMRATGDNAEMARAQGIDVSLQVQIGLALANALAGLSGALFAEYQGFASVQMSVAMFVTGLACVVLGEAVFGTRGIAAQIAGVVGATVLFRALIAAALRSGLDPNALKLLTAAFVLAVLAVPSALRRVAARRAARDAARDAARPAGAA
jgi:putative ABC transport system permease protein